MLKSFVDVSSDSDFSIYNLPYGVFSTEQNPKKRIGVAIGNLILDLSSVAHLYPADVQEVLKAEELNPLLARDKNVWHTVRITTQNLLLENSTLSKDANLKNAALVPQATATMHLPVQIGDYTDFFASAYHAINCGKIFRGNSDLLPNWKRLPVGYHGRASSIVVSGTPIRRPYGQLELGNEIVFDTCKRQDFELEMACYVGGKLNQLGERITASQASDYIFGFSLMNDWSSRDIQKWESVPLGPFTSKNVGTTVGAWIVTIEALQPFLIDNVIQEPVPFDHLKHAERFNFDINLSVAIKPQGDAIESIVTRTNFRHLYWTALQELAHHTQTGCNMRPGDLIASGTISGPTDDSLACLFELTWNGTKPLKLAGGQTRGFLEDGDQVIIRGYSEKDGVRVGFGETSGIILPAQ